MSLSKTWTSPIYKEEIAIVGRSNWSPSDIDARFSIDAFSSVKGNLCVLLSRSRMASFILCVVVVLFLTTLNGGILDKPHEGQVEL